MGMASITCMTYLVGRRQGERPGRSESGRGGRAGNRRQRRSRSRSDGGSGRDGGGRVDISLLRYAVVSIVAWKHGGRKKNRNFGIDVQLPTASSLGSMRLTSKSASHAAEKDEPFSMVLLGRFCGSKTKNWLKERE